MNAAPYIKTPKELNDYEDELLEKKEYKIKYFSDYINILIGKTKNNIIIRNYYYEIKLDMNNLSILTKTIFKSIDESFEFFENIFNQNKVRIKNKTNNYIILVIITYDIIKGKEKKIELYLKENFENKNFLIKELFDKYINLEKTINEEKNNNKKINEENIKLKEENMNMKIEIESLKKNKNNDIEQLKMKIMNQINEIQQQINQFMNQINQIQQQMNSISMNNNIIKNSNNIMNKNDFNLMNNNIYNNNIQKINLNNSSSSGELLFRLVSNKYNELIHIDFKGTDLISTLIKKFRNKSNIFCKDIIFIYNKKFLNEDLTADEAGLIHNSKIFIVNCGKKVIFKILGRYNDRNSCLIRINYYNENQKLSELIDDYLRISGLTYSEIIQFFDNSKRKLKKTISIKDAGLKDNFIIYVEIKESVKLISVNFQSSDKKFSNFNNIKLKCLKSETIVSLIMRYLYEVNQFNKKNKFIFNSKELNLFSSVEESKLLNVSTIFVE